MDNSFYLKNGSVLWNGAFTPLDMAVEDGRITALSPCSPSTSCS